MTVKFVKSIPFTVCKSEFLSKLKDPKSLAQCKELDEFVINNHIKSIHNLIINHRYCSLDELKSKIISAKECACQYLYLSVNKFYIYSTVDTQTSSLTDYDRKLVDFCCDIISDQYVLVKYTIEPTDQGTLGNFVHPVTTMFFKRYV